MNENTASANPIGEAFVRWLAEESGCTTEAELANAIGIDRIQILRWKQKAPPSLRVALPIMELVGILAMPDYMTGVLPTSSAAELNRLRREVEEQTLELERRERLIERLIAERPPDRVTALSSK